MLRTFQGHVTDGVKINRVGKIGDRRGYNMGYRYGLEDALFPPLLQVDPLEFQFLRVNRLFLNIRGNQCADNAGEHQGNDNMIVIGQFKDDKNRGNGGLRGGGYHGTHSDQGVGPRIGRQMRELGMEKYSNDSPRGRPEKERGRENPSRSSRSEGNGGGKDLDGNQNKEKPERKVPV